MKGLTSLTNSWLRTIRFISFFVFALFLLITFIKHESTIRWNIANWALIHADTANNHQAMFTQSTVAIGNYKLFAQQKDAHTRLLQAYQLKWRAATRLAQKDAALQAYTLGHTLSNTLAPEQTCQAPVPNRVPTAQFNGVRAGALNIPITVEDHQAVLMFTTAPISQSICLQASGIYNVHVRAANMAPPPIELHLKWDGWLVDTLSFNKGDGSLETQNIKLASTKGYHVVTLVFANDFQDPVRKIDRNAIVDYLEFSADGARNTH